jgi:cytochrome c biogenesis protein CcmG/thiol:disulfide interchange protein DsbE
MKETRKDVLIGLLAIVITAGLITGGYFVFFKLGRPVAPINRPVWIGDPAPAFTLAQHENGEEISLESLQGQPVVLNFWSVGCPTCLEELAEIEEFYRAHREQVRFFAINTGDPAEAIEGFLKKHGIEYPLLLDRVGETAAAYGLTGIPETVFIDRGGIVRYWIVSAASSEELEEGLRSITAPEG